VGAAAVEIAVARLVVLEALVAVVRAAGLPTGRLARQILAAVAAALALVAVRLAAQAALGLLFSQSQRSIILAL
jgi:hypothetical protein